MSGLMRNIIIMITQKIKNRGCSLMVGSSVWWWCMVAFGRSGQALLHKSSHADGLQPLTYICLELKFQPEIKKILLTQWLEQIRGNRWIISTNDEKMAFNNSRSCKKNQGIGYFSYPRSLSLQKKANEFHFYTLISKAIERGVLV